MEENITGIILAGGKSSRMGTNKALLEIDGKKIIERIADVMKSVFRNVILISNSHDEYEFLGLEIFKDIYINNGPLAGIHSGLVNSTTERNFITSCDVPFINEDIIKWIISRSTAKSVLLPVIGKNTRSLFGIYSKSVIRDIEIMFKTNKDEKFNSIYELLKVVDADKIEITDYDNKAFANINTPEDYKNITDE